MVRRGGGAQTYTEDGRRRGQYQSGEGKAENGPGKGTAVRRSAANTAVKVDDDEMNDSRQELSSESNK